MIRIGALDDGPRRLDRLRRAQHVLARLAELVVTLGEFPILLRHSEARQRIFFELLETGFLLLLRQVQPQLHEQRFFGYEHALELDDAIQPAIERAAPELA